MAGGFGLCRFRVSGCRVSGFRGLGLRLKNRTAISTAPGPQGWTAS